ncbi:MAG TPA: hypothetical protein VH044_18545 [Polyangiaceae bacterium]|jgi:hypothetical protein|nr:hypothetical protein [Polyangiaceae bacterium]
MGASNYPATLHPAFTPSPSIPEAPQSSVRLRAEPTPAKPAPVRRSAPPLPRRQRMTAALVLSAVSIPALLIGGGPIGTLRALGAIVAGAAKPDPAHAPEARWRE